MAHYGKLTNNHFVFLLIAMSLHRFMKLLMSVITSDVEGACCSCLFLNVEDISKATLNYEFVARPKFTVTVKHPELTL